MSPNRPTRTDVSAGRRLVYHLGQVLVVVGLLLFFSVFLTFFQGFGAFPPFPGDPSRGPGPMFSSFARAPLGIVLAWIGGALIRVGRQGVAGSGLTLDPQGTRADEEPWNRARGGMLEDTLDASPTLKGALTRPPEPATVVKIRCRACGALNDEADRFCGQCGQPL